MYKQKKKQTGITLIALIITIIVLIILAGVSINMLVGENGIINMAQKAKNETEQAQKEEEQVLAGLFGKSYADYNGQLHVEDGKLLNQYNEQIQLNGLYYGYGNSEYTEALLRGLKNKGVNMIKIGYNYSGGTEPYNKEGNMEAMFSFIDQLLAMDFYVDIIYWSDINLNTLSSEAIDYFTQIANKYPNNEQILYEICNEPFSNTWEEIKNYADRVIPKIRQISENAIISIPTNNNLFNEIFLSNLLSYNNIMYVTHIYGEDKNSMRSLKTAIANNIPVFISEWSNINAHITDYNNELTDNLIYIINEYKLANSAWYFDESKKIDSEFTMIKKEYWEEVLKTGSISSNALGIAGKYYFDFVEKVNEGINGGFLINYSYMNGEYFWKEEYRNNITKILFEDRLNIPDDTIEVWDVSYDVSGSVMAYIIDDGNNTSTYELHICGDNKKVVVTTLLNTFQDFSKLEYIDISRIDTSKVKIMTNMFRGNLNLKEIIGLNNIDTSNVENMSGMFHGCHSLEKLDLKNFDTSKVKSMGMMFFECINLKNLDISNFNTLNLESMGWMFSNCHSLDNLNLSNFDTSNVTDMGHTFAGTGKNSSNFELIFGEKFDTSKVNIMDQMFYMAGFSNPNLNLDLTSFTFRDDLSYTDIFGYLGSTVKVYVKDEVMQQFVINARGENAWSTTNVLIK